MNAREVTEGVRVRWGYKGKNATGTVVSLHCNTARYGRNYKRYFALVRRDDYPECKEQIYIDHLTPIDSTGSLS